MTKRMNVSEKRSTVTTTVTNMGSENNQDLPNEIWKDVPNYEGEYQVSNLGRIKSLSRSYLQSNGKKSLLNQGLESKVLIGMVIIR